MRKVDYHRERHYSDNLLGDLLAKSNDRQGTFIRGKTPFSRLNYSTTFHTAQSGFRKLGRILDSTGKAGKPNKERNLAEVGMRHFPQFR